MNLIIVHELLARSFPANQPLGVWLVIRRLQFRAKRLTVTIAERKPHAVVRELFEVGQLIILAVC